MVDKWFKVLDAKCKAKDGGSFDYSKFVESKEWTPVIKDKSICWSGYHVTKYWNMFVSDKSNRVFEVEVKDLVEEKVLAGVCEKAVCSSLRIVKEFIPEYKNDLNTGNSNTGDRNTGEWNTGDWNTGDWNTGDRNTGEWNTGDSNTGDSNTGDSNTGDWNTGDSNTGDRNTGDWNTGEWNTGYSNTGDRNTGDWNTGNSNTGDRNTGEWNTGYWNTGSYHAGAFNTKVCEKVYLFDKEILKTEYDKIVFPSYFRFELDSKLSYSESWGKSFESASKVEVEATIKLPNFDYKVFEKVTGISKKMIELKLELKA